MNNTPNSFWDSLVEILGVGVQGYGVYKSTTWIDKLLTYIPLVLVLLTVYLIYKK